MTSFAPDRSPPCSDLPFDHDAIALYRSEGGKGPVHSGTKVELTLRPAAPGADGAGLTLLEDDRADTVVTTAAVDATAASLLMPPSMRPTRAPGAGG